MVVGDAHVFPGFLSPVLTQLFFPEPPTTFPTYFCTGERRKYAGKKSRLNRGSNSQPPGHESDTLITEPPGRGRKIRGDDKYDATKTNTRPYDKYEASTTTTTKNPYLAACECNTNSDWLNHAV